MKVFVFDAKDIKYGSGIAVVSGNTKEEALGVLVDYIKRVEFGWDIRYFDLEHSTELDNVSDNNDKPSVLAYNVYEE